MKKALKILMILLISIFMLNCISFNMVAISASSIENDLENSDDITKSSESYSDYDIAVSNLLKMGWTMSEINDLKKTEVLKYKDVLDYTSAEGYTCSYIDENGSEQLVAVSEDIFRYVQNRNKSQNSKDDDLITEMSADGELNISPIWSSEYYEDTSAFSSKLVQKANLTWMGNMTYITNYRCAWDNQDSVFNEDDEPNVQYQDAIYICNSDSVEPVDSTGYFVYKYDRKVDLPASTTEIVDEDGFSIKATDNGRGYVFEFGPESQPDSTGYKYIKTVNHRVYMSHNLTVYPGNTSVVTSAGYYHRTSILGAVTSITNITSTGATMSPSIGLFSLASPTLYLCAKK